MNHINLPVRQRNAYTPEQIEAWFRQYGDIKAVAKHLGIHPASLSRIINKRLSLIEARARGIRENGNDTN